MNLTEVLGAKQKLSLHTCNSLPLQSLKSMKKVCVCLVERMGVLKHQKLGERTRNAPQG